MKRKRNIRGTRHGSSRVLEEKEKLKGNKTEKQQGIRREREIKGEQDREAARYKKRKRN